MQHLIELFFVLICFGTARPEKDNFKQIQWSSSVTQLSKRIQFLERRFHELSLRCSDLIKLKRGFTGPSGKPGVPGRDGLSGLPGRDGGPGRDGRDCPCQNTEHSEYAANYAAGFAARSKRNVLQIPYKNVTITRYGRDDCPSIKGMSTTEKGRTTIDYSHANPRYTCSRLDEVPKGSNAPGFHLFPELQMVSSKYAVKYKLRHAPFKSAENLQGGEVPCVSCNLPHVETALMFQGISECPEDWELVYEGFIMSENWNHIRSDNICVDKEAKKSMAPDFDGLSATLSNIQAKCHGHLCGTDITDASVKCTVCVLRRDTDK